MSIALLAIVCNESWLQPYLPQVMLASEGGASCQHGTFAVASACQCSFVAGENRLGNIVNLRTHVLLGDVVGRTCPKGEACLLIDTCKARRIAQALEACQKHRPRVIYIYPQFVHVFASAIGHRCVSIVEATTVQCLAHACNGEPFAQAI